MFRIPQALTGRDSNAEGFSKIGDGLEVDGSRQTSWQVLQMCRSLHLGKLVHQNLLGNQLEFSSYRSLELITHSCPQLGLQQWTPRYPGQGQCH